MRQREVVEAADGTPLAVHTHGTSGGPVVLLTNGIGTTENFWRFVIDALAPDFTVVHWDYRGHGETPPSRSGDYRLETHADDLARITRYVMRAGGPAPAHVAFSMGVAVLLELYRREPALVRAMALLAGAPDAPGTGVGVFRLPGVYPALRLAVAAASPVVPLAAPLVARVLRSSLPYRVGLATGVLKPHAPRQDVDLFMAGVSQMDLPAYWATLQALLGARGSDVLASVTVPVTIVAAEDDLLMPLRQVEALRARLPHASYVLVPDAGHAGLVEQGPRMARAVRELLARLP